jgi:HD domain
MFSSRSMALHHWHSRHPAAGGRGAVDQARRRQITPPVQQWALVGTATLLVAVCPVAIVWWLRASGAISSAVLAVVFGMGLSLCLSHLGRILWERRPGSGDLLFSELMIWGFLHRLRTQRRLASAFDTLPPISPLGRAAEGRSTKQQAKPLEQLVARMETRDPYLHGHSRRVARHAWMIAGRLGLSRAEVARIRTAAAIHDVGKIETPKAILHKAGPLSAEEYDVIKEHPGDGARMASALGDAELTAMVRHHHERLDGTGYPSGLSDGDIPLGARIIAVADTFDAITSARPYRAPSAHRKAIDILRQEAGTRLDPNVVRAFCDHYAGRRPLALWSSFAGAPERAVSWLGGGAASVASAAKVVAVAVLLGGTAATSATLVLPAVKHQPRSAGSLSMGVPGQTVGQAPGRAPASTGPAKTPISGRIGKPRSAVLAMPVGVGSAINRTSASSDGAGVGQPSRPAGAGGALGQAAALAGGGAKTVERQGKATSEQALGKSEETRGKIETSTGATKIGEAQGTVAVGVKETHGPVVEAHGTEPAPVNGKEAQGVVTEVVKEVHGKVEEVHAKVEEVVGKTKEVLGKLK